MKLVPTFATPDQKVDFLKNLFDETYISDIVGRNNVRNKSELEELLNILSSAIGFVYMNLIEQWGSGSGSPDHQVK